MFRDLYFTKTICKDTSHPVAQFLINYIFCKQSRISAIELGQESGRDVSEKEEKKPISWIVAYKYVLQGKGLFINYIRENKGKGGQKIPQIALCYLVISLNLRRGKGGGTKILKIALCN